MGKITKPQAAKLIMSIFTQDVTLLKKTENILSRHFGTIDFHSGVIDFSQTQYYEEEFGKNLKREFISFKKLIKSENLWKAKILTNKIEERFAKNHKRRVNIDPGYLTQANLILASTKMFFHRIHMNKGIYQEVTMIYQDKTFKPLAWTYPDYQSKESIEIFTKIRNILNSQLKQK